MRKLQFTDDADLTAQSGEGFQQLIIRFAKAYKKFGITISSNTVNKQVH